MTRLISEVMTKEDGTKFHMTSLKPIRPENAPDDWEREALESFERGGKERAAVIGTGEAALYRYIAPLTTEESCLKCHARQGYKLNDIRGGIGVSFPYQPFNKTLALHQRESYLRHLLFFGVGLGFILFLGRLLLKRVRDLQESSNRIRRLEGLLPICAGCKKIRVAGGDSRDQAAWEPIESYIQDRTDAEFTHGMCPECARKFFGDSRGSERQLARMSPGTGLTPVPGAESDPELGIAAAASGCCSPAARSTSMIRAPAAHRKQRVREAEAVDLLAADDRDERGRASRRVKRLRRVHLDRDRRRHGQRGGEPERWS